MKITVTIENLPLEHLADLSRSLSGINSKQAEETYESDDFEIAEDINGIDAEGLPWDERIHSSNKKKTGKGVWVRRRGLSEADYDVVKNELLGGVSSAPQAFAAPVVPVAPPVSYAPPQAVAPQAFAAPVVPEVIVQPVKDLNNLFARIQKAFQTGSMDQSGIITMTQRISQKTGIQIVDGDVAIASSNQQILSEFHNYLDQAGL